MMQRRLFIVLSVLAVMVVVPAVLAEDDDVELGKNKIESARECEAKLKELRKELEDHQQAAATELALLEKAAKMINGIQNVKQQREILTQLGLRKFHKELHGEQGIVALLDKMQARLKHETKVLTARMKRQTTRCNNACARKSKEAKDKIKAREAVRKQARANVLKMAKLAARANGYRDNLKGSLRGQRKIYRRRVGPWDKEIALIKAITVKAKELHSSVKPSDEVQLGIDESDLAGVHDPALEEILMMMSKKSSDTAEVIKLLNDLLRKIINQKNAARRKIARLSAKVAKAKKTAETAAKMAKKAQATLAEQRRALARAREVAERNDRRCAMSEAAADAAEEEAYDAAKEERKRSVAAATTAAKTRAQKAAARAREEAARLRTLRQIAAKRARAAAKRAAAAARARQAAKEAARRKRAAAVALAKRKAAEAERARARAAAALKAAKLQALKAEQARKRALRLAAEKAAKTVHFKVNGWSFYKTLVPGNINSASIRAACKKINKLVPCDHPSYADGHCAVIRKRNLHFSHKSHLSGLPAKLFRKTYWYCGRANKGKALQNVNNSHRWTAHGVDRHGWVFCVSPPPAPNSKKVIATWRQYKFHKVRVPGQMNSAAILRTCNKLGYNTPCDHNSYADGKCVSVFKKGHMSYNRHHDFSRSVIDRTYWYCGRANGGRALQNWRNTHRWSKTGDMYGTALCIEKQGVDSSWNGKVQFKVNGWGFYKTRVQGRVTPASIRAACKKLKMTVPCDHPSYYDGRCAIIRKRNLHFSHNSHHSINRKIIAQTFWYCGNSRRTLENWRNTHRWSSSGDIDGATFCVKRIDQVNPKAVVAKWRGYKFYKVRVPGQINSAAILRTCSKYGYDTPCDHSSYADGKCINIIKNRHMSYNRHHDFNRAVIDRTYWYCGRANGGKSLQNWRNTHRWSRNGDVDGAALCISKHRESAGMGKVAFHVNGWAFHKTRVQGIVSPTSIQAACAKLKMRVPCDHPSYYDGRCAVIRKRNLHFSHNSHHSLDRKLIDGTFWYCGKSRRTLENWRNSHRWSNNGDKNGATFCVKRVHHPNPRKVVSHWRGWRFHKVRVPGQMNSAAILRTCSKLGYNTPCDHNSYADGKCISVIKTGHMSYNRHHDFNRRLINRSFWYCGRANGGRALQNWRNTHRWSKGGDWDATAFCIEKKRHEHSVGKVNFHVNGWAFYKTQVKGIVSPHSIRAACARLRMRVPCDHPAYYDGRCAIIRKRNLHFSHNSHHSLPRHLVANTYWYCGNNRRTLENWRNTHRWSGNGDQNGATFCVRRASNPNPRSVVATWKGWKFYKVRVWGQMNSAAILHTCNRYGLFTPCDHRAYYDGRCKVLNGYRHMSYNRHHNFNRAVIDRTYWYCGRANGGKALQNWRNTHRWSRNGDWDGTAMCVKR